MPDTAAQVLDTHTQFVLFDGDRGHSVCDYIGTRYSLVYFSIAQYEQVPLDQRGALPNYPSKEAIRQLSNMLAPPRGYNGLRQKSIQEAFGFAGKHQALRWQPVDWTQLPPEVLLCVARFAGASTAALLSKRALQGRVAKRKHVV